MIARRSFMAALLGAAAAPAIVKAESLMKLAVPRSGLITGELGIIEPGVRLVMPPPWTQDHDYAKPDRIWAIGGGHSDGPHDHLILVHPDYERDIREIARGRRPDTHGHFGFARRFA